MRIKVRQTDFLDIEFDNDEGNTGDNSDSYNFTIETHSQHCTVNGVEMPKFTFTIIGNIELNEFFNAIQALDKLRKA